MSLKFVHHELKASEVPADVRVRVETAAIIAARLLDLPRITVRYFVPIPSMDAKAQGDVLLEQLGRAVGVIGPSDYDLENGYSERQSWLDSDVELGVARWAESVIWINPVTEADPFTLVNTVGHECAHRAQFAHMDEWQGKSRDEWEAAARAWAEAHTLEIAARVEAIWQAYQASKGHR